MTVDRIVAEVRRKLDDPAVPSEEPARKTAESPTGKRRKVVRSGGQQRDRTIAYLAHLRSRQEDLEPRVHEIRRRKHTTFFATVGNLQKPELVLDVRIQGRNIGQVTIPASGDRLFTPMQEFKPEGWIDVEWRSEKVRALLDGAWEKLGSDRAKLAAAHPKRHRHVTEAMIQQAGFAAIASAAEPFRGLQPIRMFTLPFQFPMPLRGSEKKGIAVCEGDALGHADILVRVRPSTLAVLELKKPGRSGARTALSQAVAYAAALEVLLERDRESTLWALGYDPQRAAGIKLEAWAVVDAVDEEAVRANAAELQVSNHHYPLSAWLYDFTEQEFRILRKLDLGGPLPITLPG